MRPAATDTIYRGSEIIEVRQISYTMDQLRVFRNQALADSDWTAVKDRTMSQAWKDYRQALRDLPQDHADANTAVDNWPQPPE